MKGGVRMVKSKAGTAKTIGTMLILGILIIVMFQYFLSKDGTKDDSSLMDRTELEVLLDKDYSINYPATPRDVAKAYSRMLKCMYSGLELEDAKLLGLKMRELYDVDFLRINPMDEYNKNLEEELIIHKEKKAYMMQYEIEKSSLVQYSSNSQYQTANLKVLYTTKEKGNIVKSTERIYMRLDEENHWKIYGWELVENANNEIEVD